MTNMDERRYAGQTAILTKAVEKAVAGGYVVDRPPVSINPWTSEEIHRGEYAQWLLSLGVGTVIFRHDFAKALWGLEPRWYGEFHSSKMIKGEGVFLENIANCDYHLQQMVIADDPIKYLGEYLQ